MKMTPWARSALAFRRQRRILERRGYRHFDDGSVLRIPYPEKIADVIVDTSGEGIYILTIRD